MRSNSVASATNLVSPPRPITPSGTPRFDASVAASSSVAIAEVSRYRAAVKSMTTPAGGAAPIASCNTGRR